MEIYDCKVLVGGSRNNEVRKFSIPAPEILMLRHIHGEDSVIDVVHVGTSKDLTNADVRELLTLTYGPGDVDMTRAGPAILKEVFGPPGVPLPSFVEGVALAEKKKAIPPAIVKRWRETKPDAQDVAPAVAGEPAFAD